MKLNMNELCEEFGIKTDMQRIVFSELVFQVISGNKEETGFTSEREGEVRKVLFGDAFGTLNERVLAIAGYWGNDLEYALADELGLFGSDRSIFERLFDSLEGKEVVEGICFRRKESA